MSHDKFYLFYLIFVQQSALSEVITLMKGQRGICLYAENSTKFPLYITRINPVDNWNIAHFGNFSYIFATKQYEENFKNEGTGFVLKDNMNYFSLCTSDNFNVTIISKDYVESKIELPHENDVVNSTEFCQWFHYTVKKGKETLEISTSTNKTQRYNFHFDPYRMFNDDTLNNTLQFHNYSFREFYNTQNASLRVSVFLNQDPYVNITFELSTVKLNNNNLIHFSTPNEYSREPICKTLMAPSNYTLCRKPGFLGEKCEISCREILGPSHEFCEGYKICSESGNCRCSWHYKGEFCDERRHTSVKVSSKPGKVFMIWENLFFINDLVTKRNPSSTEDYRKINDWLRDLNYTISVHNAEEYLLNISTVDRFKNLTSYKTATVFCSFEGTCSQVCVIQIANVSDDFEILISNRSLFDITVDDSTGHRGWMINQSDNFYSNIHTKYFIYLLYNASPEVNGTMSTAIIASVLALIMILCTVLSVTVYYTKKKRQATDPEIIPLRTTSVEDIFESLDVDDFGTYVLKYPNTVKSQFRNLPETESNQTYLAGLQKSNVNKNRDSNLVIPYDYNRVILQKMEEMGRGDYINASYIEGFTRPRAYIACQGPKFYTVRDFWRMIWQENVEYIIMASTFIENNERMCAEYWTPKLNTIFECGQMTIQMINETCYEHYDFRQFEVCYTCYCRKIIQFQLKWSSGGPFYPNNALPVVKNIREVYKKTTNPIVIHSGYGINRCGTLILCDLALNMAEDEQKINFYTVTRKLRKQRQRLVHKMEHYILAHLIVMEYLMEEKNPFKLSLQRKLDSDRISQQFSYLKTLCWHDTGVKTWTSECSLNNYNSLHPLLVDGYGKTDKYIITQQPLEQEVEDFWSVVGNEVVSCVIFLNNCKYKTLLWPYKSLSSNVGMHIRHLETRVDACATSKKLSLLIYETSTRMILHKRKIVVYEINDWRENQLVPASKSNLLKIVKLVNNTAKTPNKILVACRDGVTACGLFVVLSYIIEKYERELEMDVCNAIRIARRSNLEFVNSPKQLKYIYSCIREYLKNFELYNQIKES